jgi:peptidoglycan hydrolase-like protein with peptidoglycan-binding domain
MWPFGSGSLGWFGARHDQARRSLATVLVAVLCFALTPSVEAPAQTAPWDIETIQVRLLDLGYDAGEVDGLLGPRTRAALRAFQADRGLPATGLPDGNTQRALLAAEPPESAAGARTPRDDPPSLDAVPLVPVRVAPLAPLARGSPHKGFSIELLMADQPDETAPPASTDRGMAVFQRDTSAESEPWGGWIKWAAAALAVLGALLLFAAVGPKSAKQQTVVAEQPRPFAAVVPSTMTSATMTPSTISTVRGGHVFGVDIPSSEDSGPG